MTNPYEILPDKAFWRKAVSDRSMFELQELWDPKFEITRHDRVVTFGSCFAQHIGKSLKGRGFNWFIAEQAPESLSPSNRIKFSYDVFSARTGNIYTASLLLQWVKAALGERDLPGEIWEEAGRYYDPLRPSIEPDGFRSEAELLESREVAVRSFKKCIVESDVFVFTLGLTESWWNSKMDFEYPLCPGTVAGRFSEESHEFRNQHFSEILDTLSNAIDLMQADNKGMKTLLTVSPVPLVATNSGLNVLVATMQSKSVLRAVAGQLAAVRGDVDYFPSYEIINSPVFRGVFFAPNQRNVAAEGVKHVMDHFFGALEKKFGTDIRFGGKDDGGIDWDAVCEEELLDAFGR